MISFIVMWSLIALIVAGGSAYFAARDPRSTSLMKIAFSGVLFVAFIITLAGLHLIGSDVLGEGLFAHVLLFLFFWPMAAVGAPLCLGTIVGTLIGMYRKRKFS